MFRPSETEFLSPHPNKFIIHSIDFTLMVFSIIAIFLFILGLYVSPRSPTQAVHLIMGGEFTLLFWVLVIGIGILLPLSLEVYELIPHYMGNAHPTFSSKNDLFSVKLWFTKFTSNQ